MSKEYTYSLDEALFTILGQEFNLKSLVSNYVHIAQGMKREERGTKAQEVFSSYGSNLATRILELEGRYRDRAAELIYEVAERTGLAFPNVPQRLLEIAIYSVRPDDGWDYREISHKRLAYEVTFCTLYEALKEAESELVAELPCRYACLETAQGIYRGLGLNVDLRQTAEFFRDGRCKFEAWNRTSV